MRLDEKPLFKKAPVPWYETERACFLLIIAMFILFLFGFAGVSVAYENAEYGEYLPMPVLLIILSGTIIVSTVVRLIRRYIERLSE